MINWMKRVVKQVVGIDVSQDELVSSFGYMYEDISHELVSRKVFDNSQSGFEKLLSWVGKLLVKEAPLRFVMEATGVYHQKLAYHLFEAGNALSIVLPNKISNYARTLTINTVTDKTMADAIMQFGLERKLEDWAPPKGIYHKLQQLTRERNQLVDEKTVIKNQLHAERVEGLPHKKSIERANKRLVLAEKQEKEIKEEIKQLIAADEETRQVVLLLCTIPGIGLLTAATILGETNCFELIRNKRQLASYAGFDVKDKQSGTSVKGKASISKKGNRHLRKAMHMPSLSTIKSDKKAKAVFEKLLSKHGIKMKALVAVQRRLLEMAYTIYKTGVPYDKEYMVKQNSIIAELA